MTIERYRRNSGLLLTLLVLASGYFIWQGLWPTLTYDPRINGGSGVVLGLFVCSRPAANGIDLFFAERGTVRRLFTAWSGARWLLLNAVVMLVGWFLIVAGASRLTGGALLQVQ
jgi:hypothetical protein